MTHPAQDHLLTLFNGCEAVLWIILAAAVLFGFRTAPQDLRRVSRVMAALLVAFALSDVIEMRTGAWWRPPALLVFKGVCLVGLIASTVRIITLQRGAPSAPNESPSAGNPD